MKWAALIAWLVTAGGGFVLLAIWLARGGMGQGREGGSRIPPPLILSHFLLAATGLVIWIVYLFADKDALAWIAFAILAVVAVLGWTMFAIWLRRRQARGAIAEAVSPATPAEQHFPVSIVGLPQREARLDDDRVRRGGEEELGRLALPRVPVRVAQDEDELPICGKPARPGVAPHRLGAEHVPEPVPRRARGDRWLRRQLDDDRRPRELDGALGPESAAGGGEPDRGDCHVTVTGGRSGHVRDARRGVRQPLLGKASGAHRLDDRPMSGLERLGAEARAKTQRRRTRGERPDGALDPP